VGDDGFGDVADVGELFGDAHVFESARIVFGGEEVIAVFETEAFADVFEGVGEGPADANGFFCESEDLLFACVERVFGENPGELVGKEVGGEEGFGVDGNERIYCAHGV